VLATAPVVAWARRRGCVDARVAPCAHDGIHFEVRGYQPIPWATPTEAVRKTFSGLRRPVRAAGRLRLHLGLPHVTPTAWALRLPDGRRFVHLGGALHRRTPEGWLGEVAAAWRGADLLLVAPDHDEAGPIADRLPVLAPKRVL